MSPGAPLRMVVVIDGLRRESINDDDMPCLSGLLRDGATCTSAVTVVPSLTRPAAATLGSGYLPRSTGIIGNRVHMPSVGVASTGFVHDLHRIEREAGQLVCVPSLGKRLAAHGKHLAVVGTGSAGCTHLLYPDASDTEGTVIRASAVHGEPVTTPASLEDDLERLVGPRPSGSASSGSLDLLDWATTAATEVVLPAARPDLLIFWCGEPDETQHFSGIDHRETRAAIAAADRALDRLITSAAGLGRPLDLAVTSDHGACTTGLTIDPSDGAFDGLSAIAGDLVFVANDGALLIYTLKPIDITPAAIAAWALTQPWAGPVFVNCDEPPAGALPMSVAGCDHPTRAPAVLVTMRTEDRYDGSPIAWRAADPAKPTLQASHGTSHVQDLGIPLAFRGSSFKRRVSSPLPAGLADLAATMEFLVAGVVDINCDGRVMHEVLLDGSATSAHESRDVTAASARCSTDLRRSRVDGRDYVHQASRHIKESSNAR